MLHTKHCQWPGPSEALRELYGKKRCLCRKGGGEDAPRKRNCAEPMCGFQTHEKVLEALGVLGANGHYTLKQCLIQENLLGPSGQGRRTSYGH